MNYINYVIEKSKHNTTLHIDTKYIYVRRFPPHLTLRFSKKVILEDNIVRHTLKGVNYE